MHLESVSEIGFLADLAQLLDLRVSYVLRLNVLGALPALARPRLPRDGAAQIRTFHRRSFASLGADVRAGSAFLDFAGFAATLDPSVSLDSVIQTLARLAEIITLCKAQGFLYKI